MAQVTEPSAEVFGGVSAAHEKLMKVCLEVKRQCNMVGVADAACEDMMRQCSALQSPIRELEEVARSSNHFMEEMLDKFQRKEMTLKSMPALFFQEDFKNDREILSARSLAEPVKSVEPGELGGNFLVACRCLHVSMFTDIECDYDWKEFCSKLDGEGTSEDRWSAPLHRQLAGALRENGFSTNDWEISLLSEDGVVLYSPRVKDLDETLINIQLDITEAQADLECRIRYYHRQEMREDYED